MTSQENKCVLTVSLRLCQFFAFMFLTLQLKFRVHSCLITSPPPPTPSSICLFSYFRLFASNYQYFGSWLYSYIINSQTNKIWPQHYYVPCGHGLYTKNLSDLNWKIWNFLWFGFQFRYMYWNGGKQVELSHTLYCKHSNQNTSPST